MKNTHNIKNVIIVALCITIISMAVGFMVLSSRLERYRNEEDVFDVRFTNVRRLSSIKGGTKEPIGALEIEKTGKILDMNFRLFKEHDEIDYEVTIKNEGTVEASIVSLFSSPDFRSSDIIKSIAPITISISDISGKILEPGEETTVRISAIYTTKNVPTEALTPGTIATVVEKEKVLSGKVGIISESKN